MKNLFFSFFTICTLCACQKASIYDEGQEQGSTPNLVVSIFKLEQTPFSAITRAELAEACSRLNFAVYDLEGKRVDQVNQATGSANFGTASFQLEEGDYQLVIVAHSSDGNPTMTDLKKIQFTNKQGFSDTFLYYGNVTIGEDPVEMYLTLNRIVALCRFIITDDYPENVSQMRFYYTGGSGAFDASTGFGSVNSKQSLIFDVTNDQKQFDLYTFPHDVKGTLSLIVTAYDNADNIIKERDFEVPVTQNQIMWLTGPYFTGSGSSSTSAFSIDINTDWAGENRLEF